MPSAQHNAFQVGGPSGVWLEKKNMSERGTGPSSAVRLGEPLGIQGWGEKGTGLDFQDAKGPWGHTSGKTRNNL